MGTSFMKKLKTLIIFSNFAALTFCSPTSSQTKSAFSKTSNSIKSADGVFSDSTTAQGNFNTSATDTTTISPRGVNNSRSSSIPNYQSGDLGSNFNRNAPQKLNLKPTADANKVFLVQLINSYRPVWYDLATAGDSSAVWTLAGKKTTSVSVFQPIASFAGSNELAVSAERGDSFKIIGHTLSPSLTFPPYPTAVLSLYAISSQDPLSAAISPPMAYQKVYSRLGPMTEDLLLACKKVNEAYKEGGSPSHTDDSKCKQVTAGGSSIYDFLNVQMGGSTTTGVGDLSTYYQLQTLVIWKPIPPAGYQCLGQIVTNTTDQPQTIADAAGIYAQYQQTLGVDQNGNLQAQAQWDYPVYCVQQKYLVEGTLHELASNGSVNLYSIVPKDSKGLANTNVFWALPTSTSSTEFNNTKVYLLNTDYVKLLPPLLK